MATIIIIIILIIIVLYAFKNSLKHIKGESGCCGGTTISTHKNLSYIMDQKEFKIEGMHCQNCVNKIENAINKISYLACHVNLDEKKAIIQSTQIIDEEEIKNTISKLGYHI